jgi:hypothetical protein
MTNQPKVIMFQDPRPALTTLTADVAATEQDRDAASLTLLIRAPNFNTFDVTTSLGITPDRSWKPREQVVTPLGIVVPGSFHSDAGWSYTWCIETKPDFDAGWQDALSCLERGAQIIRSIKSIGPTALVLIFRSSHVSRCGASIPSTELRRLAELEVDFEFEIFADQG